MANRTWWQELLNWLGFTSPPKRQPATPRKASVKAAPRGSRNATPRSSRKTSPTGGGKKQVARRAFYSFHYKPDCTRASQVRNMGVVEGNQPASDNSWESITKGGDSKIQEWIDDQMSGRSCVVVLIGSGTAGRKWINYEIKKGWQDGKGLVGIYIHNLKDLSTQKQSTKGGNPFASLTLNGTSLSSIVKAYDPPYSDSKDVYGHIKDNLSKWIEEAITIRGRY